MTLRSSPATDRCRPSASSAEPTRSSPTARQAGAFGSSCRYRIRLGYLLAIVPSHGIGSHRSQLKAPDGMPGVGTRSCLYGPATVVRPKKLSDQPIGFSRMQRAAWQTSAIRHPYTSERMHTMSMITTRDGTQIFYKDWSSGRPVVFSHGWPLSADAWDGQMMFLGERGGIASSLMIGTAMAAPARPGTAMRWTPMPTTWLS